MTSLSSSPSSPPGSGATNTSSEKHDNYRNDTQDNNSDDADDVISWESDDDFGGNSAAEYLQGKLGQQQQQQDSDSVENNSKDTVPPPPANENHNDFDDAFSFDDDDDSIPFPTGHRITSNMKPLIKWKIASSHKEDHQRKHYISTLENRLKRLKRNSVAEIPDSVFDKAGFSQQLYRDFQADVELVQEYEDLTPEEKLREMSRGLLDNGENHQSTSSSMVPRRYQQAILAAERTPATNTSSDFPSSLVNNNQNLMRDCITFVSCGLLTPAFDEFTANMPQALDNDNTMEWMSSSGPNRPQITEDYVYPDQEEDLLGEEFDD